MKSLKSNFPYNGKSRIGFFLARLGPSVCLGSERARAMEKSNRIFDYGNSATSRMQHYTEISPIRSRRARESLGSGIWYFPHFALSRGFTCPVLRLLEVAVRSRNAFFSHSEPAKACTSNPSFLTQLVSLWPHRHFESK